MIIHDQACISNQEVCSEKIVTYNALRWFVNAGIALRVPTPNVSIVDLVIQVEKKTFAEEVNAAFKEYANGPMKGILEITEEPLVSLLSF